MPFAPQLEVTMDDRDRFFLKECYRIAHAMSNDPFTKIAAVITRDFSSGRRAIAYNANQLNRRIEDLDEAMEMIVDREWKYRHMDHAEPGSIDVAGLQGESTQGATMYMPWAPCTPCGERIFEAKIAELVMHESMLQRTPERWWESTAASLETLKQRGIRCKMYTGNIGGVVSTFDSQVWLP